MRLPTTQTEFAEAKGFTVRTIRKWRYENDLVKRRIEQLKVEQSWRGRGGTTAPTDETLEMHYHVPDEVPDPPEPIENLSVQRIKAMPDGLSDDERQYREMKYLLAEQAMGGSAQALQTWFTIYGKAFANAEAEQMRSRFPEMSDDELEREIIELLSHGRVSG